ncbi:NodT family efflux transporter outer membrane factor (OMF) lipoprotein [Rhizomicrobium palustre]|uniref:NodT family efflux transporter outer membrane factor (OMF) lipoprotein n=1 Tax=Rhizomicrobium palustre TaxID=189966 RepID=A0A846MV81_9PROT|nr:efflux transporter outer membrane subunit [Rhizomicrobium palustre]NIK87438.1 NodT family efflux transporter outer membrane factor (OMF) lipoprotein [Rhizomicrobium palustre]
MKKAFLIGASALFLAGCVSAPPTEPQLTKLTAEKVGLAIESSPAIAPAWWKAFGDPELNRLVDEALKGNPSLAAAMARLREAQSQLATTSAATLPQINGDARSIRERLSKNYVIPPPYAGSWQWVGTAAANLSWSLDLFGKEAAQVDRAKATAEAAALDAEAARLALAGAVTNAYVQLAQAYALIDAAKDTVRQREEVHQLVSQRFKAGLDNPATAKQSSAQLALAREELLRDEAQRDAAVHMLAALTGKGIDGYAIARPRLNETALSLPQTLSADLLARRADIAASKARVTAALAGRQAAHQAFYPDINLLGTAGFSALGMTTLFTSSSLQYGGGAAIHLPIFDAGVLRANYAGATARLDEAVADYNQSLLTAVRQTADAITGLRSVDAQATEQVQALADATESYNLTVSRYKNGLASELSLLSVEDTLIQARRQSALLQAEKASVRVALVIALGGGFDATQSNKSESHE